MRFLKMLFHYLLLAGGVLVVGGFFVSQVFLLTNALKVSDAYSRAKRMAKRPDHVSDCAVLSSDSEHPVKGYQVRFENEKEYVIEAVCTSPAKGPFEVFSHSLTLGVKRMVGYSGVLFPILPQDKIEGLVMIGLGPLRWRVEVGENANMIYTPDFSKDIVDSGSDAANATCEGWGYQCCDSLSQVGVGEQRVNKITDCSTNCFSTCKERPAILIFTSDPQVSDPKERVVRIPRDAPLMLFSYSVQDADSENVEVEISFGDGEMATSTNQTDQFSHMYGCNKSACRYTASLKVVDAEGNAQSRSRISEIYVIVR